MTDNKGKNSDPTKQPTVKLGEREYPLYGQDASKDSYCPPPPHYSSWTSRERCPSQISLASSNYSKSSSHAELVSLKRSDSEISIS